MEKEMLKITLENDLNRQTIRELLSILRNCTDSIYNNMEHEKLIEIMGKDIEVLKNYYKQIIESIEKLGE